MTLWRFFPWAFWWKNLVQNFYFDWFSTFRKSFLRSWFEKKKTVVLKSVEFDCGDEAYEHGFRRVSAYPVSVTMNQKQFTAIAQLFTCKKLVIDTLMKKSCFFFLLKFEFEFRVKSILCAFVASSVHRSPVVHRHFKNIFLEKVFFWWIYLVWKWCKEDMQLVEI